MQSNASPRPNARFVIWMILLVVLAVVFFSITPADALQWMGQKLSSFGTVFLGIFIEAVPFLLMGTVVSGLVEMYLDRDQISRWIGKRPAPAAFVGAFMGFLFPVCECGVVPLTRRLFRKGLPLSAGIAFLLAAPVLNPIVMFSTAAAFGWGQMLLFRMAFSLVIAVSVGLVFSLEPDQSKILRDSPILHEHDSHEHAKDTQSKIRRALAIGADEFFEMGRYLVMGAALAAALQTFIPQSVLLAIGSGPLLSVLAMLTLAILLSICSTVDAFVALGFVGTFSFGSILSFLVFGPMVDIKSVLMYLQVFTRRAVIYLVALPFLFSLLFGVLVNYWFP